MNFIYKFEPLDENFPQDELFELERQISKSIPFLEKNLPRLLDYLKKEDDMKNYIEINLPFFESNISFKLNFYHKKLIISVMLYDDTEIFGHLLIDEYDCLDKKGIIKLGGNLKISKDKGHFKGIY